MVPPDSTALDAPCPTGALIPLPADDDTLVRAVEAPRYLGIAAQTLSRWRHEGIGPSYVKLGRLVFYRCRDLRHWIERQLRDTSDASRVSTSL